MTSYLAAFVSGHEPALHQDRDLPTLLVCHHVMNEGIDISCARAESSSELDPRSIPPERTPGHAQQVMKTGPPTEELTIAGRRPVGGARVRTVWTAVTGTTGFVVGLLPHVLHHVAPVLGAAFLTGAVGTASFGALGLVATIPMLNRLHRRFNSWWAPALALALFLGAFLISTFVLGPRISGALDPPTPAPSEPAGPIEHDGHHPTGS